MKAIMYHYVRPHSGGMPYLRYLGLDDFVRQLDYFENEFGFVDRDAFIKSFHSGEPLSGVILTFDDAFKDHYDYVLPVLLERGLFGIFYIPTDIYFSRQLLDVHRIHCLLGILGGATLLPTLRQLVTDKMISYDHVEEFRKLTYSRQDNDEATTIIKRLLNYFLSYKDRRVVLKSLMEHYRLDEISLTKEFYVSPAEIRELQEVGMIIGNHTCSHPVLSKLGAVEQRGEIEKAFKFLDEVTGGLSIRTFCYPYGGFHSFNKTTERILDQLGCQFAFNVEPRNIETSDLLGRPQALPRFPCHEFPFGKARIETWPGK